MAIYNDLFIRSCKRDTNNYPKPASLDAWTSPDIIVHGTAPCKEPVQTYLGGNFDRTASASIRNGMLNYIYLRGKNYATAAKSGKLYLYWCDSALLLAPSLWMNQRVPNAKNGRDFVDFSANAGAQFITANEDGGLFAFEPNAAPHGHYCLISRVVTPEYPAPIPDIRDIHDFTVFIRSEASMGYSQKNISFISSGIPEYSSEEVIANPYNKPIEGSIVKIACENVPEGCEIQLTCPGSTSSCHIEIPRQKVRPDAGGRFVAATSVERMPALFQSRIKLHVWFNGIRPTKEFTIRIEFIPLTTPNYASFRYASPLRAFALDRVMIAGGNDMLRSGTVDSYFSPETRGALCGSCVYIGNV